MGGSNLPQAFPNYLVCLRFFFRIFMVSLILVLLSQNERLVWYAYVWLCHCTIYSSVQTFVWSNEHVDHYNTIISEEMMFPGGWDQRWRKEAETAEGTLQYGICALTRCSTCPINALHWPSYCACVRKAGTRMQWATSAHRVCVCFSTVLCIAPWDINVTLTLTLISNPVCLLFFPRNLIFLTDRDNCLLKFKQANWAD